MTGKKQTQEQTAATNPDAKVKKEQDNQAESVAVAGTPTTGHAKMARDPAAVGAGPGNQIQLNNTESENETASTTDVKPGSQPDGEASINKRESRNEGIE